MFTITFENEVHQQWSCEYVFNSFEDAKDYLINHGYVVKNRLFERHNYNWNKFTKAYIEQRKIYNKGE